MVTLKDIYLVQLGMKLHSPISCELLWTVSTWDEILMSVYTLMFCKLHGELKSLGAMTACMRQSAMSLFMLVLGVIGGKLPATVLTHKCEVRMIISDIFINSLLRT